MNAPFHPQMVNGPVAQVLAPLGTRFTGLALDSREVRPGDLFLALPGEAADGRKFIPQAIAAGAAAVAWDSRNFTWNREWSVPNLPVADLRAQLGEIADAFYGHPSRHMTMVGVTGTNGKTSCSHWVAQAFDSVGRKASVIGTVGSGFPGELQAAKNTTPDAVSVHRQLAALLAQGAQACAMEVSSHGLDQGRVNAVEFDTALFTNLSRDHLDYHGTMEAYGAAKARLFQWPGLRHAVVNLDDPFGRRLAESLDRSRMAVLGYGMGRGEIAGHNLALTTRGLEMDVRTPWGSARLASPMLGEFNASNLLGVLGVLLGVGIPLADAIEALAKVRSVPGRMQLVREAGAPLVVVDYAHTPDALEKALGALRRLLPAGARLFCVFGCGGDRDPGKRPLMGEVATRLAHHAVVTSDNPRSEDPLAIIQAIVAGAHPNHSTEPDRAAAIAHALYEARVDDVVLIAGKGHETYQEANGVRLPFDDAEVARELMRRLPGKALHA
jgi:UDP-N-acetylmuramoyl-L-alanyl-D-glutamate--2,6-diaminopimelate ligase